MVVYVSGQFTVSAHIGSLEIKFVCCTFLYIWLSGKGVGL